MIRILFLFFLTFVLAFGKETRIFFLPLQMTGVGRLVSMPRSKGAGGINDVAKTPHFDKLARSGVLFTNASVNAPSCTPCRSSILSGRNFWETGRGAILQGAVWDENIPTWPLLLKDSGYHIGYTYKVWSPGTPGMPGSEEGQCLCQAGGKFNGFSQYVTGRASKGVAVKDAKGELYREARGNFKSFLDGRKKDQPFAYWFGPTNVHRKWTKGSGKKLWDIDPDETERARCLHFCRMFMQ
jgi:arylsulfatase A-like enzyme